MDNMNTFTSKTISLPEYIKTVYTKYELIKMYKGLNALIEDSEEYSNEIMFVRAIIEDINSKIAKGSIVNITVSGRNEVRIGTFHNVIYPLLLEILVAEQE